MFSRKGRNCTRKSAVVRLLPAAAQSWRRVWFIPRVPCALPALHHAGEGEGWRNIVTPFGAGSRFSSDVGRIFCPASYPPQLPRRIPCASSPYNRFGRIIIRPYCGSCHVEARFTAPTSFPAQPSVFPPPSSMPHRAGLAHRCNQSAHRALRPTQPAVLAVHRCAAAAAVSGQAFAAQDCFLSLARSPLTENEKKTALAGGFGFG